MTTQHDRDRSISAWLVAEAPDRAPDDVLEASRHRIRVTRQRRSLWPAWRNFPMNSYAKLISLAAAVLVVAVAGYQFLPGDGGSGAQPTIAPSPTLLARGSFTVPDDHATELDATGAFAAGETRAGVTGTMTLTDDGSRIAVDLDCARNTEGGLLVIAGTVSDSTADSFAKGSLFGIILQRASPVRAGFMFGATVDGPCLTFIGGDIDAGATAGLKPIEGSIELAP